jgi:hypothetical protein
MPEAWTFPADGAGYRGRVEGAVMRVTSRAGDGRPVRQAVVQDPKVYPNRTRGAVEFLPPCPPLTAARNPAPPLVQQH